MPKVSVIIPTCNRSGYLRNAIASVLSQTLNDFELVVVDDASTDDTGNVVKEFRDKSITYIRHDENHGGSVARNTGIAHSQSEYIAFLDDDDEWEPTKLASQVSLLDSCSSEVGAIYSGHRKVNRYNGEITNVWRPLRKGNIYEELMKGNCVSTTSSVLIKRECLEKVGNFDEKLPSFQDYDLWIRIAKNYQFEYVDEVLVTYYEHGKKIWSNKRALKNGIKSMVEKYGRSNELNKTFSYYCLWIGVQYLMNNDMKRGRELLLMGVKLYPFELQFYLFWGASLLGSEMFQKSRRIKKTFSEWLKKNAPEALE